MGGRGPLPKQSASSRLKFTPGIPPAPDCLCEIGKAEYDRIAEILAETGDDYLQMVDLAMLTIYASNWARMMTGQAEMKKDKVGPVISNPDKGTYYANPWMSIVQAAETKMLSAAQKLGFSPYDRRRIDREVNEAAKTGLKAMLAEKASRVPVKTKRAAVKK